MKFIKKIIYPHKYNTDVFIKYLKQRGVEIGEHTKFINPVNTYVDEQNASYLASVINAASQLGLQFWHMIGAFVL